MNLKRLWDTENKKMVRAKNSEKPYKALQVRTNDDGSKLYVYDHAQWIELQNPQSADVETYGPVWKSLTDETVGYYLTNEPTDLYSWDSGDEVAYRFMNGTTVLQSGKIDEGQTPEYTGETPTKPSDSQYTYTFSGWKPTVGPIYKKTDFKAQYTSTPLPDLPELNNVIDATSENSALIFDDGDGNYIEVAIDTNQEDPVVIVSPYGVFDDERYVTQGVNGWAAMFKSIPPDGIQAMINSFTEFPSNIFSALEAYYINPTAANYEVAVYILIHGQPLPELENYISTFESGLNIFGDAEDSSYVEVYTETAPETGDNTLAATAFGTFDDAFFWRTYGEEDQNCFEYIFTQAFELEDVVHLVGEGEGATDGEWKSGVWSALQTCYTIPTEANADAVIAAIEATRDSETGQLEPITWTIPESN